MRRPLLVMLAVASPTALILLTAVISPAQASAITTSTPAVTAAPRPVIDQAHPVATVSDCSRARGASLRHPHEVVSCVTVGTVASRAGASRAAQLTPSNGFPGVSCDSLPTGNWWILRLSICVESNFGEQFLVNGNLVGTSNYAFAEQINTSATRTSWTESDYATLLSNTGIAAANSLGWTTSCSSPCTPASSVLWPLTPIAVGQTLHGTATFSDAPAAGSMNVLKETPTVTMGMPGASPPTIPHTLGTDQGGVRCDNGLAVSNSAGCVVPNFTPTLSVSTATYGASAAMISWAQANLSGHWGLQGSGQPLTRLASNSQANTNRNVVCPSSFPKGSTGVANDSCDEFPFAKTYQSGALNGVTSGSQCAQVTAVRTATTGSTAQQWAKISVIGTPTGSEKCIRGHIPLPLNTDVGGELGRFTQAQRLINKDPYWLAVTS
jgi:hypothetical protein